VHVRDRLFCSLQSSGELTAIAQDTDDAAPQRGHERVSSERFTQTRDSRVIGLSARISKQRDQASAFVRLQLGPVVTEIFRQQLVDVCVVFAAQIRGRRAT
jgi:hypothetical protein